MAREKSSDRAEARRRHRAEQGSAPEAGTGQPRKAATAAPPSGRVGIVEAFRLASGPADLRGDLAALPSIATKTPAVWLPTVVMVITGLAYLSPDLRSQPLVAIVVQSLLAPPAMIPSFLAGFLTRRGSWLVGGIAGLISALIAIVIFAVIPGTAASGGTSDYLLVVLIGPLFGASVGAFAGFYRRFLALSSPNRGAARRRSPKRR